jgi:cell division protein ZapE
VSSSNDVLRALYARETAKRGLHPGSGAGRCAAHLERLRSELLAAPLRRSANGLLRGLTRDNGNGAPRGVYLWGGVGRGKTWLMDLFLFEPGRSAQKRRTHFYRFMQEVHADLKRLKGMQSPLEGVAGKIAKKSQVICFDELFVSDIADAMILAGLFGALLRRGVALVFTSKRQAAGSLQETACSATASCRPSRSSKNTCEVVAVEGGVDYRLRQLTAASIYLPSAGSRHTEEAGRAVRRSVRRRCRDRLVPSPSTIGRSRCCARAKTSSGSISRRCAKGHAAPPTTSPSPANTSQW